MAQAVRGTPPAIYERGDQGLGFTEQSLSWGTTSGAWATICGGMAV